jgi:hypothetical protein
MLDDEQKDALRRWYSRPEVIDKARDLQQQGRWEDLEEHINMISLMPLSKTDQLPDYLLKDNGEPLIPNNVNPHKDIEEWRDAIEVGWEIMNREIGVSQTRLHQNISRQQSNGWDEFLQSVERRKKERGEK